MKTSINNLLSITVEYEYVSQEITLSRILFIKLKSNQTTASSTNFDKFSAELKVLLVRGLITVTCKQNF